MKILSVVCLMAISLSSCCVGQLFFPTIPTPTIPYHLLSAQGEKVFYVVVDGSSNRDRAGLQSVADYLCNEKTFCEVLFWDDINKAATGQPISRAQDDAIIAVYIYNENTGFDELLVYTLGD